MSYKLLLTGLIGVLIGVVVSSGSFSVDDVVDNVSESLDRETDTGRDIRGSVSIRDLATNPADYEGDQVTVEGEVEDNVPDVKLTDGAYTVQLYLCEKKYSTDFGFSHSYEVTGVVVNPPGNEDGYMIQCSEAPRVTGEVGPLAN